MPACYLGSPLVEDDFHVEDGPELLRINKTRKKQYIFMDVCRYTRTEYELCWTEAEEKGKEEGGRRKWREYHPNGAPKRERRIGRKWKRSARTVDQYGNPLRPLHPTSWIKGLGQENERVQERRRRRRPLRSIIQELRWSNASCSSGSHSVAMFQEKLHSFFIRGL